MYGDFDFFCSIILINGWYWKIFKFFDIFLSWFELGKFFLSYN